MLEKVVKSYVIVAIMPRHNCWLGREHDDSINGRARFTWGFRYLQ